MIWHLSYGEGNSASFPTKKAAEKKISELPVHQKFSLVRETKRERKLVLSRYESGSTFESLSLRKGMSNESFLNYIKSLWQERQYGEIRDVVKRIYPDLLQKARDPKSTLEKNEQSILMLFDHASTRLVTRTLD